jgi:DNA-directed RNA polymerase subunit E'/Rpb7
MFVLAHLEDNLRIAPDALGKPRAEAAVEAIEKLYLDKVLPDVVRELPITPPFVTCSYFPAPTGTVPVDVSPAAR